MTGVVESTKALKTGRAQDMALPPESPQYAIRTGSSSRRLAALKSISQVFQQVAKYLRVVRGFVSSLPLHAL